VEALPETGRRRIRQVVDKMKMIDVTRDDVPIGPWHEARRRGHLPMSKALRKRDQKMSHDLFSEAEFIRTLSDSNERCGPTMMPCHSPAEGGKAGVTGSLDLRKTASPWSLLSIPKPSRVILAVANADDGIAFGHAAVWRDAGKILKTELADFNGLGVSIGPRGHAAIQMAIDHAVRIVKRVITMAGREKIK